MRTRTVEERRVRLLHVLNGQEVDELGVRDERVPVRVRCRQHRAHLPLRAAEVQPAFRGRQRGLEVLVAEVTVHVVVQLHRSQRQGRRESESRKEEGVSRE